MIFDTPHSPGWRHPLARAAIPDGNRRSGYDPNQPRVPAGYPDGGQWTRIGGVAAPRNQLTNRIDWLGLATSSAWPGTWASSWAAAPGAPAQADDSIRIIQVAGPLDSIFQSVPLESGGRGGGGLIPSGYPSPLPQFTPGGKTSGVFRTPTMSVPLQSGRAGPASSIPRCTPGFDAYTRTHVEGHAAALMRHRRIQDATVFINNPTTCPNCMNLLPRMLPPGSTLNVVLPNGVVVPFRGINP
jgi:hypothetical protein